eukprot:1281775-Prymnesium_polylepis.1
MARMREVSSHVRTAINSECEARQCVQWTRRVSYDDEGAKMKVVPGDEPCGGIRLSAPPARPHIGLRTRWPG